MNGSSAVEGLAADIAEAKLYDRAAVCGQRNRGDAGQLSDLFAVRLHRRTCGWQFSFEPEPAERAMDVTA